jgi:saccharopine dehydrogenase (NAD+, L-lysine forming)
MKIAIIREGKIPADSRTPLTPKHCKRIQEIYKDLEIIVQSSEKRCYTDQEYRAEGIAVRENIEDCDLFLGVKEVPIEELKPNKTYFFFSHTIKGQAYNRNLLRAILQKKIHLIDYEVLTNDQGQRIIAFGYFAGMVGAHNGIYTYGKRTGSFDLPRLKDCKDYSEALEIYKTLKLPNLKIVLTGTGRVAKGAARVLEDMKIRCLSPKSFINETYEYPVYTQLTSSDYVAPKKSNIFDKNIFYQHPEEFYSTFMQYAPVADILINGIYYDPRAPAFFTLEEMAQDRFKIKVIADVTCDIAPKSSIPSTIEASTIEKPVFGFHKKNWIKTEPHCLDSIDMMTIDNLPNELPRDASLAFGDQFIEFLLPEIMRWDQSEILDRATIAKEGVLGKHYQYLENFLQTQEL